MEKPVKNPSSIIKTPVAANQFDEVLKKAKETPQFISENNKVEWAVVDYTLYETLSRVLDSLRDLSWEAEIVRRLEYAEAHPEEWLSLEEALGKEACERILNMDTESIPDEELFE